MGGCKGGSGGGITLSVGVLGNWVLLLMSVRRMEGGRLDGRDSVKMLAGLEKPASNDCRSLRGVGVPGLEPCGDGIRSRS
ncbi:hypothetical protein NEMBOFW57_004801 [Staphylotrichum longicolle]|uniref:Uncharacterized protein n=1 Tax=Staphylotrichum longicolle TaxID=669026 RepID=A0AAD4HZL8_9PEZI|nr:hypothetical protein NEMBOFW57_004801 [Staphylotrichum longicolle]